MDDLFQNQQQLQKEANGVIEILDLQNVLNKYGTMQIVGSLSYGLMTWRDIDIDLMTNEEPQADKYWEIVKQLFSKGGVKNITLADNRNSNEQDRPKSMYIGVKYQDTLSNIWKIDIRILAQKDVTTDETADFIKEKITDETRKNILEIKSQVCDNPNYHKGFSSVDIYEAVLLNQIKDLTEFKEYLTTKGKKF